MDNQTPVIEKRFPSECKTHGCHNTFQRNGTRKEFCDECAAKRPSSSARVKKYRAKQKKLKGETERGVVGWDSGNSIKKEEALTILAEEWGITRTDKAEIIYEEGLRAAERNNLVPSQFYWRNGPVQARASVATSDPAPQLKYEGPEIIPGKVTFAHEDFALWQFYDRWRTDGCETFEEYLAEQWSCITGGTIDRGNKYFGKDFHDQPHKKWDEVFISWTPGLSPNYTQEDSKAWLASQSEEKKRLLVACRNSYKSNFTLVYLVGAVLCDPDLRILLISETKPLSKSFIRGFRSFWEISDPYNPTRFQRLFRFFCIPADDGSALEFESPMAHLNLFQPTAASTSMDSQGQAGGRFDIGVFDDPISNMTVTTEDQRLKSQSKFSALLELQEVGGYVHYNATPWHEDDLTATILEQNEKSQGWLFIIDPAWTVKPECRKNNETQKDKTIWELQEEDVDLLFPARLTWKVLQKKLKEDLDPTARTFRMQSLCMFLPDEEETDKLHFDRLWFTRNTITVAPPTGEVYGTADLAFTKSKYRDPSALTLWRVTETRTQSPLDGSEIVSKQVTVLTQEVGYWDTTEKARIFVRMARMYPEHFKAWIIEKYTQYEDLARAIELEAMQYSMKIPIVWSQCMSGPTSAFLKYRNLKAMETPLQTDKVKFLAGPYLENLIAQCEMLEGTGPKRQSNRKHDDAADSLQLGIRYLIPKDASDEAELKKIQEAERAALGLKQMHDRIFGSDMQMQQTSPQQPEQDNRGPFGIPRTHGYGNYGGRS